jgi:phosphinothricin acetyltransferase
LHQSLGFKPVGHLHEVGFKFGRWLDLAFLQLML